MKQTKQKPWKEKTLGHRNTLPTNIDLERAARIRGILEALYEINKKVPVIVEGKKDGIALRTLGLIGDIITLHRGVSLYEFCEEISEQFDRVMILLDWDDKGEQLQRELCECLKGIWEEYSAFRDLLKILCQKDIKDIEGIPKLLKKLEGNAIPGQ